MGAHILSYGGKKPVPFQQAICESQALEPGITANFTIDAMKAVTNYVGCNGADLHSPDTILCLRDHDMDSLLDASLKTYRTDANIGDIWLPSVDGDFLPDHPSELIIHKQFAKGITVMMGWCYDDLTLFTDTSISTDSDTRKFITSYVPTLSSANVDALLWRYPVTDFSANNELSSEFYRSARIFRDIIMTCQPLYFADHLAQAKNTVYLYEWNQTILGPILDFLGHPPGMGPVHTSEFAYIFGNLSHYNTGGFPFNPSPSDYELTTRASRSWSTFASVGKPGLPGHDTFQGFTPAFERPGEVKVFVMGGPNEGLLYIDGPQARNQALVAEELRGRCEFLNSREVIEELRY